MLINCPECKREISDTVSTCPHCGFNFKPNKTKAKRKTVFLSIAIISFVVALFAPITFRPLLVLLITTTSIISLIRKEKLWPLPLLTLILTFFLLIYPILNIAKELDYTNKIEILSWDWERNGNYTFIKGSIKNIGDKTVIFHKVKASYLDRFGNVLDTGYDNSPEQILPGNSREFAIIHEYNADYEKVELEIEKVNIK